MTPENKKRLGEAVVPGITLLFVSAYFYQTMDAPETALFWPLITAGITGVFFIAVVFQFIISSPGVIKPSVEAKAKNQQKGMSIKPLLILFGPVGYLIALPYLGFTMGNFIFMLLIFRGLGSRSRGRNVVTAFVIAAFLHTTLILFMKLSFPRLVMGGAVIL